MCIIKNSGLNSDDDDNKICAKQEKVAKSFKPISSYTFSYLFDRDDFI